MDQKQDYKNKSFVTNIGGSAKKKKLELISYAEVEQLKKLLKSERGNLWKFLQKAETLRQQK